MKNTIALKNSNEFQRVLKKGEWFPGDLMSVYVLKNTSSLNYLGIAVGKKFSKSSVKRNRAKRLIKEAYRLNEELLRKGYLIVIVLKNNVTYDLLTFKNIYADFIKSFKKANILMNGEESNV